jgi:hypothetical protein
MNDLINENLVHLRELKRDFASRIDGSSNGDERLLNELAGMFAVTVVASYEGIVKETLISHAGRVHVKYEHFIQNEFGQMNSRITINDLKRYSNKFGLDRASDTGKAGQTIFHEAIRKRTPVIEKRYRTAFEKSYEKLFSWRNQYAHQRAAVATLDEVYNSHRVAKHVIIEFARSFEH